MVDIDEKLLLMNTYLKTQPFNRADIAQSLHITERQLTRLLKKWDEEGLINYEVGVGRGNNSDVTFLVNIEQAFLNMIIRNLPHYSIEEINQLMKLPLTSDSLKLLESAVDTLFYNQLSLIQNSHDVAVDCITKIPQYIHPLTQEEGANVVIFNAMDRLYEEDEYGIVKNLVAEDEWKGNILYIYLYRDIKFSNGQLLFASDVVNCLNNLMRHPAYKNRYQDVETIELINSFTLKVSMTKKTETIKQRLSCLEASIYKEREKRLIATGRYKVEHHDGSYIRLHYNDNVHHHLADLQDIYLVDSEQLIQEYNMEEKTLPNISADGIRHVGYKNVVKNAFGVINYGEIIVDSR